MASCTRIRDPRARTRLLQRALGELELDGRTASSAQTGAGRASWITFSTSRTLHLGEHVLVPDLAGWRRERMPRIQDASLASRNGP